MSTLFELLERIREESVVYYHSGSIPNIEPPRNTATINWMSNEIIEQMVESEKKKEKFKYFLNAGYSGLLVHNNGSWIAYGWISKPKSKDVPYQLPDWIGDLDLYWLFYARTKEEYRKNGWHKYVLIERLRAIYSHQPNAAIFTDANEDNVSRFSMLSAGFEPIGKITSYRFGYPPRHIKTVGRWNWGSSHPPVPDSE